MTEVTLFDTVIQPMTETEARSCVGRIKTHLSDAKQEILSLYERDGWQALGYSTWIECVQVEFKDYSAPHIYRLRDAAQVERNLTDSPFGENAISEGQLRPIAQANLQPEQQRDVWQIATESAPNGKVTADHVATIVKEYQVYNPLVPPDAPQPIAKVRQFTAPEFVTVAAWELLPAGDKAAILATVGKSTFNETNDNIEWAGWSWNPVTGCLHDCPYCYARDIANRFFTHMPDGDRFAPAFYPERLTAPKNTRQPNLDAISDPVEHMAKRNVFVCSMADLFGKWVPTEWIEAVLEQAWDNPQWNFLFLTKFPIRMAEFEYPPNSWIGTTVDHQWAVDRAEKAFKKIRAGGYQGVAWLSCEPMLEQLTFSSLEMFDWVIMGGCSKSTQTPEERPEYIWHHSLFAQAKELSLPVYMKTNLGVERRVREYPEKILQPSTRGH